VHAIIEKRKVSRDAVTNAALPLDVRQANQEHDIILLGDTIVQVVDKYTTYIDQLILKEKKKTEFWEGQQARVASGAIWAIVVAVFFACAYQLKEFFGG
jgi:hypothetical protein